jgi:hypothetical protein
MNLCQKNRPHENTDDTTNPSLVLVCLVSSSIIFLLVVGIVLG